ncbi:hypothetical protein [Wenzhouxiangella marina]|uniref:Uncharacterized protein n=1 Tax=Wenzhouxiangella marina TaxID=1579979 RepID=A0A0K0XYX1_9GAMM|nr:hypothetical protein [Wenzhouxiangella marina]AKS42888.1 hypothetical protein WM2015_2530 [Wenzhouxiangella marina]MBB6087429.1 hypothetical protein [Wenzhouxiangella marina]
MIVRFLASIVAGALVGGAIHEGLLAGLALFMPAGDPLQALLEDPAFGPGSQLALLAIWTLVVSCSSAMAAGLSQSLIAGWVCAGLWLVPIGLLIGLGSSQSELLLPAALSCLLGALIGTRLQGKDRG